MKRNIKEIPLRVRITSKQEQMIQDFIQKEESTKSEVVRKSINYYFSKVKNGR